MLISPGFYLTFWQLSTYDLAPPTTQYHEENTSLNTLSRQEMSKINAAESSSDRSKRLTASSHRQRRERYIKFAHVLTEELKEQTASREFTLKRLTREKQHWFAHCKFAHCLFSIYSPLAAPKTNVLMSIFIEHCIQPRCLLSPMDADYCAQMIKVIHTQGTPGFYTLRCYDWVNACGSSMCCGLTIEDSR